MANSKRRPYGYRCFGVAPKRGKIVTSRRLRKLARKELLRDGVDFDFCDLQDKNRGIAGSRAYDYGWEYFGDGRKFYGNILTPDALARAKRK